MNIALLADELADDPLSRDYASMTDADAAADLNTAYRSRNRAQMSGDEIFQQTDDAEFAALTDTKKDLWVGFTGKDAIDPFAQNNVDFVVWVFGSGSATVSSLSAARVEAISRAEELGLGTVEEKHVRWARLI